METIPLPSTWKSVVSTNTKYTMRLVIASSPRLASLDVVFPPRIALCVTFWSFHARCKPDGRTGRGHWRGGRVHELRVEGEEGIRNGHRLVRRHVCSAFAWSCEMKDKKKGDKRKKRKKETLWKWKFHLVVFARRFASREGFSVGWKSRWPGFRRRKCSPHSRREIFGAGHFVLRSWSHKGIEGRFCKQLSHDRLLAIHRGIASKGLSLRASCGDWSIRGGFWSFSLMRYVRFVD